TLPCFFFFPCSLDPRALHSFPTRRSSDLNAFLHLRVILNDLMRWFIWCWLRPIIVVLFPYEGASVHASHKHLYLCLDVVARFQRSEEHTSELQSRFDLVCRLLLEKKKTAN